MACGNTRSCVALWAVPVGYMHGSLCAIFCLSCQYDSETKGLPFVVGVWVASFVQKNDRYSVVTSTEHVQ